MKTRVFQRSIGVALVATSLWASSAAMAADDPVRAAQLYKAALELMEQKKFAEACPKFAEARRLNPSSLNSLISLAKCYDLAGKTASAWARYQELAFEFKKQGNADGEQAARKRSDELEKTLSKLQISTSGDTAGLVIHLDGEDVPKAALGSPVPADPGKHVIEATAPGFNVWQTTVTVGAKNDNQKVEIPPLVAKPKPSNSLRTAAYVTGGVGLAGLVVGGVFGGLAASDASSLEKLCPDKKCSTKEAQDARASANTKALVSTIGIGVGGAALATGVVLFIVSRSPAKAEDQKPTARLVPSFGPGGGSLDLIGKF